MELFDYIKFHWKALAILLVVGAAAIVTLGRSSGSDVYTAKAQLLVRPPSVAQSGYGTDTDRYISTQMALMYTTDYLAAEVSGTSATPGELAGSLSYTHQAGTELVTLSVKSSHGVKAISMVNAAAQGYISHAQSVEEQPAADEAKNLGTQITRARKQLSAANMQIQRTVTAYVAANPDDRLPSADTLAPRATAQANLSTARLTQLLQQQSADAVDSSASTFRSSLLRTATRANLPGGWGRTTYLAAVGGLILVLLVLAGVGLALTRRIISEARWNSAISRGQLGHPVRVRRLTRRQRQQSARRVLTALSAVSGALGSTWSVAMPAESKSLRRKTDFLLKELEAGGVVVGAPRPLTEALTTAPATGPATGPASGPAAGETDVAGPDRVLLLVDLNQATVDDAAVLTDYPTAAQRLMVPVLI